MFKYCPFCGQKLVSAGSIVFKYCPECGGQLENINAKQVEAPPAEIKREEEHKLMQTAAVAGPEISIEAKQFFDKLKGKLPGSNICLAAELPPAVSSQPDFTYYSLILKSCDNKEELAHALKQVLTRSFLAIRMAIDNMPGILVYKGKVDGIVPIVKVLRTENAGFSIVPGNFNFKMNVACIFPNFNSLFPEVQSLIKGLPLNLWLGENILGVFPDVYQEALGEKNKGALVISDQALYFVYRQNYAAYSSVVIPYTGIEQLFLEEGQAYDGLIIGYKDGRDEDMLVIADELILSKAYEVSHKALKNQQNSIWIKSVCPKCGHAENHALDDETADEKCLYCDKKFQKTLVKNECV
ncbi:MAG: hypothetical protein LLG02_01720 [Pelosinus sp.]|nr:hypothetical protein [Pelosinus sp.]